MSEPKDLTLTVEPEVARDPVWKKGPILILFDQESEVPPGKPLTYPRLELPLWKRLLGFRSFDITIRVTPPADVGLNEYGVMVSERLEVPFVAPMVDGDRAIWLPARGAYRKATRAVEAGGEIIRRLGDLPTSGAQLKVERT